MKPWLIKVLNGPNAGAQLLVSNKITVGTSVDCDLVLNDPHISALHCQIKRGAEEFLEIAPKEGLVFINGHQVSEATAQLSLGEVLTLGSTHLTAGPSQQLWPSVTIPEMQEVGGVPKPAETATDAVPTTEQQSGKEKEKPTKKRGFSPLVFFLLTVIIVCFVAGMVLFRVAIRKGTSMSQFSFYPAFFHTEEKKIEQKQGSIAEISAADLRKKFPNNTIKVIGSKDDIRLFIYVRNQVESDQVRKYMNENFMPIPSNIINIDDIDDSALAMMSSMNLAISVVVDPDTGKVIWNGYLPNQALLDSVKEQIARDLPAITEEEFHITLGTEAAKTIQSILEKNQLFSVHITPEQKEIALTGAISFMNQEQLQQALQEIDKVFDGQVKIMNMTTMNNQVARSTVFSSPVVSVAIGSSPYVVLQNGERIFLGAKVQDGYIVSAITTQGIELINGRGKKLIPISGEEKALF